VAGHSVVLTVPPKRSHRPQPTRPRLSRRLRRCRWPVRTRSNRLCWLLPGWSGWLVWPRHESLAAPRHRWWHLV